MQKESLFQHWGIPIELSILFLSLYIFFLLALLGIETDYIKIKRRPQLSIFSKIILIVILLILIVGHLELIPIKHLDNKSIAYCAKIQMQAKNYVEKLETCLILEKDEKTKINLSLYKDRCDGFLKYDCEKIISDSTFISESFKKADQILGLCRK